MHRSFAWKFLGVHKNNSRCLWPKCYKKINFFHTGTATPQTSAFNACACRSILLITCNCCEVVFKFLWSKVIIIIILVCWPVFQDSLDKPVPEWQIILDFNAARRQWCRALRHTKLQSDYHHMSISSPFLTGQMPFLSPNQQCQNTEGKLLYRTVLTWGTSALQGRIPPPPRARPTTAPQKSNSIWWCWNTVWFPILGEAYLCI